MSEELSYVIGITLIENEVPLQSVLHHQEKRVFPAVCSFLMIYGPVNDFSVMSVHYLG